MELKKILLTGISAVILSGCVVVTSPSVADVHIERSLSLDAADLQRLNIDAGAGKLIVIGDDSAEQINVIADVYTTDKRSDEYELALTESGSKAYLVAKHHSTSGFWVGNSPRIDVKVILPSSMLLDIDDGSGEIKVKGMNNIVEIDDGSGDIYLNDITANVYLSDGSGELTMKDIKGDVELSDGSGDIVISAVEGNLDIDDGSGELIAEQITGRLVVEDSSGDMTIRNVSGEVVIDDGSGDIDIKGAGGLRIIEAGSGDLKVRQVKGDFEIES